MTVWLLIGKESTCQCRRLKRHQFDPWVRKIPWSRKWQPAPVFLLGKSHGLGHLMGGGGAHGLMRSPWVCIESDMTESTYVYTHTHTHTHTTVWKTVQLAVHIYHLVNFQRQWNYRAMMQTYWILRDEKGNSRLILFCFCLSLGIPPTFFIFYFTFFYFTILYWFCHTSTWILHGCTWVPNPPTFKNCVILIFITHRHTLSMFRSPCVICKGEIANSVSRLFEFISTCTKFPLFKFFLVYLIISVYNRKFSFKLLLL